MEYLEILRIKDNGKNSLIIDFTYYEDYYAVWKITDNWVIMYIYSVPECDYWKVCYGDENLEAVIEYDKCNDLQKFMLEQIQTFCEKI